METKEYIKWFENILGVNGLNFKYTTHHYDANNLDGFEFEREILTRKVLYYNSSNNVISTHSPYGSHWEKSKDVKKIIADENFRWVIKGDEFLSRTKFCCVKLINYDGSVKNLGCFNAELVEKTYKEMYEVFKMMF